MAVLNSVNAPVYIISNNYNNNHRATQRLQDAKDEKNLPSALRKARLQESQKKARVRTELQLNIYTRRASISETNQEVY